MKKEILKLSLVTAILTAIAMTARADDFSQKDLVDSSPAPKAIFKIKNNSDRSSWITVYNLSGSIRDSSCLNAGEMKDFTQNFGNTAFRVRAEVTREANCTHDKVAEVSDSFKLPTHLKPGLELEVRGGGLDAYELKTSRMLTAQAENQFKPPLRR